MSISTLENRLEQIIGQRGVRFIEFLGVGATGVVIDLAVTTTALSYVHYLLANSLGFAIAVTWNFGGNWYFVFNRPDGSILKQYGSYVGLHAATFGFRAVALALLIELMGTPVLVATVVGIGVAAVANYLGTERILEDGLEWFDAVAAVNSVAHVVYHSRLRQLLRDIGLYSTLYGWYAAALATIYRKDVLDIEVAGCRGSVHTEKPPEVVSVLHTLEKERPVLESFLDDLPPGATVWDVGANVGVYSVLAADRAEQVVAIEPVPSTAARCQENIDLNDGNGFATGIALGNESGQASLGLERAELGTQTPALDEELIDARDEVSVKVSRGDTLVKNGSLPTPDVVKIDVEGAEKEVLEGLSNTLRQDVEYVLVESHAGVDGVEESLERVGFDVDVFECGSQTYYQARAQ